MKFKLVKKSPVSGIKSILTTLLSIFIALLISGIFLTFADINPISAYKDMLIESVGSVYGITETLVKTTPLIFCGLGVAVAFRMHLWNIGAEGQLYMGAFGASLVALHLNTDSHFVMITLMFISAIFFGGLWALIPGALKAIYNVNETIVTLLMNYIAILWVDFLIYGAWKDPKGFNFPISAEFTSAARLSEYFDSRLHSGFFLALLCALLVFIIIEKTVWGYEIKVIGSNPKAAMYAGINIKKNIILVMFISGALSAIAGFSELAGVQHRLQHAISPGYGYTAIIIAWLAKRSAFGVVIVSFLMGMLFVGSDSMQIYYQLPVAMVSVFQGLILFSLIVAEFFKEHKIVMVKE
ncbi:MAG: ABC transporter permease [Deferribacterales bacterium]|jgi:simple sugar transport system permease protein|uniref:ABC transporter permease n=1 Tax=Deferrivibrio essentukiensis TaxID=2880922 RepID=UPI0019ADF2AD|nr:ABC transporter permease [Deferrivibrio essentukiensis]MBC7195986.1 ABC transporter permease [Deferribacterales bacterium]MBZ4671896.1 sugar transporter, permease [Deferribacteraceae bacterium]MCB4203815.1 ABC transporter permease [Deferrivibrio essentukiensis]